MEFNGTFFATIISFLVFVYLMNKVLYVPMRKIVTERKELIEQNYSAADNFNKRAKELEESRDEKLIDAKDKARKKYNEIIDDFKTARGEIVKSAQDEASEILDKAYSMLNEVSDGAKERLKGSMNDLANNIVEKIIGYRSDTQGFDDEKVNEILYR